MKNKIIISLLILTLIIIILIVVNYNSNNVTVSNIDINSIDLTNENNFIIDVRTKEEYDSGHLENSINIPLEQIELINNESIESNQKIIVYCKSGYRSKEASELLIDLGYNNVYDAGGINEYNKDLIAN